MGISKYAMAGVIAYIVFAAVAVIGVVYVSLHFIIKFW